MKAIRFKDEAARLNVSTEIVRQTFEKAVAECRVLGIVDKKNEEFIRYESDEINALVERLNSGKISVKSLAADLNLKVDQARLIVNDILEKDRIGGVLATDDIFVSTTTLRRLVIETALKNERIDVPELSTQLFVPERPISLIIEGMAEQIIDKLSTYSQVRIADLSKEIVLSEAVTVALLKKLIREGTLVGHLDMVNNVLIIERAPSQPMRTGRDENQLTQSTKTCKPKPSSAWYIVPLFFGIIGGLIGYLVVKEDDPDMATGLLWFGIFISVVYAIIMWAYWSWILSLFRF